jgi:hypothetical protein
MSEERHPQTISVEEEFSTANALAEWLTEKGFPAEVVRPSAAAMPGALPRRRSWRRFAGSVD